MTNSAQKPTNDSDKQVSFTAERANLHDFGYTRAGNVQGDPAVFSAYLDRMLNGDLVDEKHRVLSEPEKAEKRKKIEELRTFLDQSREENAKYEKDIAAKTKQIEDYRSELLEDRLRRDKDPEGTAKDTFSTIKFGINLFILIFLTGYLFFFYVSASYRALFQEDAAIAGEVVKGISSGTIVPNPGELGKALGFNFILMFVPFIFYAFGWTFHILMELKHRAKIVFISLLITLAFIANLLLARYIIGKDMTEWYMNSTFYIILFFGFLVYVLWSILLDTLIREWIKYQPTRNLKMIIRHLKQDIKLLEQKIMPVELVQKEIDLLADQVNTYMEGNLKAYIDQFTTGWVSYLAPDSMKETKARCLAIKEEFMTKHNIQPGVVKVVRPIKRIRI